MALKRSLKKGSTQPLKIETKMSSALAKMWAFSTPEIRSTQETAVALRVDRL